MISFAQHGVTKIELLFSNTSNSGSRTIRVTSKDYRGLEMEFDITLYGQTEALDLLPKAENWVDHSKREAA